MTDEATAPSFEKNVAAIRSKSRSGGLFRRAPSNSVPKPYSEVDDLPAPETPAPVQESAAAPEVSQLPSDYHLIRWKRVDGRHVMYRLTEDEEIRRRIEAHKAVDIDQAFSDYLAIQNRPLTADELARELPSRRRVPSR